MNQFEEEYILVNGIEHFLLHYPKTSDAPVLLYLHGGPGSFESLFAYELDKAWGDLFTHVPCTSGQRNALRRFGLCVRPCYDIIWDIRKKACSFL